MLSSLAGIWLIVVAFIVNFFIGLTNINTPPTANEVYEKFSENKESIQIIVDFILENESEEVLIIPEDKEVMIDFVRYPIVDEKLLNALKQLKGAGYEYKAIGRNETTISITQWRGQKDISCGIAYSIDGESIPDVQFATQLEEMQDDGWYYYVADYNEWRKGTRPELQNN